MTSFNIENATAFVTGTNKKNGIGRAIVDALLANGIKKVYATARDTTQLQELVETSNGKVVPVALDVTDLKSIESLGKTYSDVNLVINNAGYFAGTADDVDGAAKEIAVNYIAPLAIVKSFKNTFETTHDTASSEEEKNSAVVNIASIASLVNFPLGSTYSASKAASHSLTQGQRRDMPNTLVVGVYPGPIDTDMAPDDLPFDTTPPSAVADAVLSALADGNEDVFPDMMAKQLFAGWKTDFKAVEKQMAQPPQAATVAA